MSRWLIIALILLLLPLQYRLWLGDGGLVANWSLADKLREQQQVNAGQAERNGLLNAEVLDLKKGRDAIEERARSELGFIRADETFYQIIDPPR